MIFTIKKAFEIKLKKGDKGTWIVNSEMVIEPKGKDMETRGMVLYINRNTRTTKGYYFISEMTDDSNGRPKDDEKRYPVKMEHNKIIPTKPLPNDKLKKEIENFKFFVQYGNFKDINDYKDGDISYNPNVPSYSAKYQLNNDDYNVQQLRKRYDIPTKQAPKLLLKGDGDLKGSSVVLEVLNLSLSKIKKKTFILQILYNILQVRIQGMSQTEYQIKPGNITSNSRTKFDI